MNNLRAGVRSFDEPPTGFLIATNIILGLFVLGCILLVIRTLFREILLRKRARSLAVTGLGVTMADGGESSGSEGHLSVAKNGTIHPEHCQTPEDPS
ncbi:MAG TPA: hypothetical protein VF514_06015 [Bacteroidota bacterium]